MNRTAKSCLLIAVLVLVGSLSVTGCGSTKTEAGSKSSVPGKPGKVTKQDVVSFVDEAIEYAKKVGKEKAVAEFNDPKGKFVRGELYVYAYNWEGIALANGGNPSLAGQNLIDMTDPQGVKVIQELIKVARAGGGWVDYSWPYPETKVETPKLGYADGVDGTWWLGSGMYVK